MAGLLGAASDSVSPSRLITANATNAVEVPGAMPGSFSVSDSGKANYVIPIEVPPGRAGLQPSLSLVYSSTRANGVMGIGWSIGGLSTISRCPKTVAQDGVAEPVQLDEDDAFCLDGQRLIAEVVERVWRDVALALELGDAPAPTCQVIKEQRATFLQTPEQVAKRPQADTRWRNLVLAGDWTDTGVPATIEGAIRSGYTAAERVLARRS